jgi:carbon storage regulator
MSVLVLARRIGESIVIDGDIHLRVISVKGNQIRLGITAPPAVAVDRQEVHQQRDEFTAPRPRRKAVVVL